MTPKYIVIIAFATTLPPYQLHRPHPIIYPNGPQQKCQSMSLGMVVNANNDKVSILPHDSKITDGVDKDNRMTRTSPSQGVTITYHSNGCLSFVQLLLLAITGLAVVIPALFTLAPPVPSLSFILMILPSCDPPPLSLLPSLLSMPSSALSNTSIAVVNMSTLVFLASLTKSFVAVLLATHP